MVSFKVFFFFFLLNLLLVAAAPMAPSLTNTTELMATFTNSTAPKLVKRYRTRILFCDEKHWKGDCEIEYGESGGCTDLPLRWKRRVGAIRGLLPSDQCTWYTGDSCTGWSYTKAHDADLSDGNAKHNNAISSWRCGFKI